MKVEFLISTMNRTNLDFINEMFREMPAELLNAVIINQCTTITPPSYIATYLPNVKVISIDERGLSKSRNRAINAATGDICVIADDDCVYSRTCVEKIVSAYSDIPTADLITFMTLSNTTGRPKKRYLSGIRRHSKFSITGVSSHEITFRRASFLTKTMPYDERFGLGSKYPVGEENIFLKDCIDAGLSLYAYPEVLLTTEDDTTGHQVIDNPRLRGKVFRRMYKNNFIYICSIIYSSFRKYPIYKRRMGLLRYINEMYSGGNEIG